MPAATIVASTRIGAPAASAARPAATAPCDQARSSRIAYRPPHAPAAAPAAAAPRGKRREIGFLRGSAQTSGGRSPPDRGDRCRRRHRLPLTLLAALGPLSPHAGEGGTQPARLVGEGRAAWHRQSGAASRAVTPSVQASSVSTIALLGVEAGIAGEQRGQFAGAVARGEDPGDGAHLGLVVGRVRLPAIPPTVTARPRRRRPRRRRAAEPGLERPDPRLVGPARIVAQRAHDRDAGQRLAADRAGAEQLPAWLRAAYAVDQPALGQPVLLVAA